MLHVFFGTDTVGVRQKAHEFLHTEFPGEVTRIPAEQISVATVTELAGSTSLFGEAAVYLLDTPSEVSDAAAAVLENLDLLAESTSQFVVIEGPLLAAPKKQYAKYAKIMEESAALGAERFNVFAMADALLRKDKKSLWLLLQSARAAGVSSEEIVGTLLWQVKTLRLAQKTKSAEEAGMKSFPYTKAKRAVSTLTADEPDTWSRELLTIYHDGHQGVRDIDIALERFLLTL